jgi:hypothetical protein
MSDGTLALMGLSAGVGSVIGIWANHRFRIWQTKIRYPQTLLWTVYNAVDEIIGATKEIDKIRATRRREWYEPRLHGRELFRRFLPRKFREWYADLRWPVPRGTLGASPLPPLEVMAYYVQISNGGRSVTLRYTTESTAGREELFLDYLVRGRPGQAGGGLCLALSKEYEPDLFEVEWMRSTYQIRLTLRDRTSEALPDRPPMDVRSAR